jgi:secretion/DNA translocation related TadE-like protein
MFTVVLIGFISLVAIGAADGAAFLQARVRAVAAADAAALAAADASTWIDDEDPREAARRVAEANGARVVNCQCGEGAWTITVDVETDASALFLFGWNGRVVRARAKAEPHWWVRTWAPP